MPQTEVYDQQLLWDLGSGGGSLRYAHAQTIIPKVSYIARSVTVLLAVQLTETPEGVWNARGPAILAFEQVTDHSKPGLILAEMPFHSSEIGLPGNPELLTRSIGAQPLTAGHEYRIRINCIPGWERQNPKTLEWKPDDSAAILNWWMKHGNPYPRGVSQMLPFTGPKAGIYTDDPIDDFYFSIGTEEITQYTLSIIITPEGGGKVEAFPLKGVYEPGEKVTLTAIPADGYKFDSWGGDASGTDPTTMIIMDSAKFVIANFSSEGGSDIPIIGPIIDAINALYDKLIAWIQAQLIWLLEQIEAVFTSVFHLLFDPVIVAINWIWEKIQDVWEWLEVLYEVVMGWLTEKILEIWNWGQEVYTAVSTWLKDQLSDIWGWMGEVYADIKELVKSLPGIITGAVYVILDDIYAVISAILGPFRAELERILQYNSPEVRAEIISWWPTGTSFWDWLKAMLKTALYFPWIFGDVLALFRAKIKSEDIEPAKEEILKDLAKVYDSTESIGAFVKSEIADPILDAIKDLLAKLAGILKDAFDAVWGAIKTFFTEILPSWFETLWEKLKAGMGWLWDKISNFFDFMLDNILGLLNLGSPITPEAGMGTLRGVLTVAGTLVAGISLMSVAGELIHPLKQIGLGRVSALIWDMSNYRILIGAGMGVIAAASIRIPLTWYFNSLLRPNIPSERDAAEMYNRELISFNLYSQYLSYRGYPDRWHEPIAKLTETPLRYFGLAAIARSGYYDRAFFEADLIRGGYAPESREILLDMFEKTSSETLKGIMSGSAIKRFKEGMTTDAQFHDELMILGYSEQQWPSFLSAAMMDYAYDYTMDLISAYRDAVRAGNISLDEYRKALLDLGIVPERVEGYVLRERARLKPTEKLTPIGPPKPTYQTDLGKIQVDTTRRQRRKELITGDEEIRALQDLGMTPQYATAIADNDDVRLAEKAVEE